MSTRPCPKCGADLPKGVQQCPACGVKLKMKPKAAEDPLPEGTGTTRRIVRKKSAIPSFDDSQVIETQKAQMEEVRRRDDAERRVLADQARQEEDRQRAESERRRDDDRKRLDRERAKLEQEKERLEEERRRLEEKRKLDEERKKLEEERRKLEELSEARRKLDEERRRLAETARRPARKAADEDDERALEDEDEEPEEDADERPRKKKPLDKKKEAALARRRSKGPESRKRRGAGDEDFDDDELEEIKALAQDEREADGAMPPAAPVKSKAFAAVPAKALPGSKAQPVPARPTPSKAQAAARPATPGSKAVPARPASAEPVQALPADAGDDGPAQVAIPLVKTESVGDWVADIKGVHWKKIAVLYGSPVAIFLLGLLYCGSAIVFGVLELPKIKANPAANAVPKPGNYPLPAPPVDAEYTYLPIGPIRIKVPREGPIAVDWERRAGTIKAEESVTLVFRGWSLECERYPKSALITGLTPRPGERTLVPTSYLDQFATESVPDKKMVTHFLNLTPDGYSFLQGGSSVRGFKAGIRLKLDFFPEIARGLLSCSFGAADGFFFGALGQDVQRLELFDAAGRRYSYRLVPGGPKRAQVALKYAQETQDPHYGPAKEELAAWFKKAEDKNDAYALFTATMWAAGCSMGEQVPSQVESVRSYLSASHDLVAMGSEDESRARRAIDNLHVTRDPRFHPLLLRLFHHPAEKVRERARATFELLMSAKVQKDQAGYLQAEEWVKQQKK